MEFRGVGDATILDALQIFARFPLAGQMNLGVGEKRD